MSVLGKLPGVDCRYCKPGRLCLIHDRRPRTLGGLIEAEAAAATATSSAPAPAPDSEEEHDAS